MSVSLPTELLAATRGVWVDATGRALRVGGSPTRVTIVPALEARGYRRPGLPRTEELLAEADDGALVIEAGLEGLGPTYRLVPRGQELFPAVRMGLYDDFDDDLGAPWAMPLLPYRRATAAEQARFYARRLAPGRMLPWG